MLRYLILENLISPTRVTHKIPTTILGKKILQFRYSSTTLYKSNFPFPGKLASGNSIGKKDGILGNITGYRKKRKKKEREEERKN